MQPSPFQPNPLITVCGAQQLDAARSTLREYAMGLGVDLCFQQFDQEMAGLPGDYAAPRGALLLATVGKTIAGCCALRPLDATDYPNAAEMKRLYVRKAFRRISKQKRPIAGAEWRWSAIK